MVFRKEMLVVIISVTAVLWIQTTSMRPPKVPKKKSKEDSKEQEMLFQCFDDLNCEMGETYYPIFDDECYKKTITQDVELISKFVSEVGPKCDAKNFEEFVGFFCSHQEDTKRKMFEIGSNKLVAHTSQICSRDKTDEECKRLEALLHCVGTLIKKHNDAGDCGTE